MDKCQFSDLNKRDVDELKKYLNILIQNNLINENDKIQKALLVIHPDKRSSNSNITNSDYDCATTILSGYLTYLKDNQVSDYSVKYALELQSISEGISQEDTNTNFFNTISCLTNLNPELLSEQILTRVKILSEVVFGVKYDEEKSTLIDKNPLPLSISNEYDEKQNNYNKFISQFESFECYTELLVNFEYLLCYAFLLKQYSLELSELNKDNNLQITNRGGKKRKTIKHNKNTNKKTKKNLKGGVRVENIKQYSTFWSWLTGKVGDLSGLDPSVVEEFKKAEDDIEYFKQNMEILEQKRKEFYNQVNEWNKKNTEATAENIKIQIKQKYPLIDIKTELLGDSALENNLKQLWLSQKGIYEEIEQLNEELDSLSTAKDIYSSLPEKLKNMYNYCIKFKECYSVDDNYIITITSDIEECILNAGYSSEEIENYNKELKQFQEDTTQNSRKKELKLLIQKKIRECKDAENRIVNNCQVRNKLHLFTNYIISAKFLGKDNIDLFLQLCEVRLKDVYLSKIEPLSKTQAILPIRIGQAEYSLQTPFKRLTLESFVQSKNFNENFTVTPEEYNNEVLSQKSKLLDNLTNQLIIYRVTIRDKFADLSERAESKLGEISHTYTENMLFGIIRKKILHLFVSGTFLFLNSYGNNPFAQIASSEIGKAVISSNIYSNILSLAMENPDTLVPSLDAYYLYIQLGLVIFITPNLLKSILPTFDNKATNTLIFGLQLVLIIAYFVIYFSGFSSNSEATYFSYTKVSTQESGTWSSYITPQLIDWKYIYDLPKFLGNNILLAPAYYFRNLLSSNGKAVIFAESLGLLGYSVKGLVTNFSSLSKEKDIMYKKAVTELKNFVYSEEEFDKMVTEFIEKVKEKSNTKEYEELAQQLTDATEAFKGRFTTDLQAMGTIAQSETALATKQQTSIMQQQLDLQRQQPHQSQQQPRQSLLKKQ